MASPGNGNRYALCGTARYSLQIPYMKVSVGFDNVSFKRIAIGVLAVLATDGIWLGGLSRYFGVYEGRIDDMPTWQLMTAMIMYAVVSAIVASAIVPSSTVNAMKLGAFVGFFAFFVFNVTTWGTNKKWSAMTALTDTAYGTVAWSILLGAQAMLG